MKIRIDVTQAFWEESPWGDEPDKPVPKEKVIDGFAEVLRHDYFPLWHNLTNTVSRLADGIAAELGGPSLSEAALHWYRARIDGLRAYCRYEARLRMDPCPRAEMTWNDFKTLMLREGRDLRPDWVGELIETNRKAGNVDWFVTIGRWLKGKSPSRHDQRLMVFACLYDRNLIPLEYWSNAAIAGYLNHLWTLHGIGKSEADFNREQIKQWKHDQLAGLKSATPSVVKACHDVTGEITQDIDAGRQHGVPLFQ